MKKIFFILLLNLFISFGFSSNNKIDPKSEKKIFELVVQILNKSHYNVQNMDDKFSKSLFKDYLYLIDPNKIYFLESDIAEFKKFETKLDDQIKNKDLAFFYLTYERVLLRMKTSYENYVTLFKNPNTFKENEIFNLDDLDYKYPKNENESKNRFKSEIKFNTIRALWSIIKTQNNKIENDINYKPKDFSTLEQEARDFSFKKYDGSYDNYSNLDREYFLGQYINSIIAQFDPHSKYISPKNKEKFEINLTGKKKNVGLIFRYNNNFLEIKEVLKNSLANKSKKIDVGDILLKVADGNKEPIDVVGLKFYELNRILDGKIGNPIHLTLKKLDGKIYSVTLKREDNDVNDILVKSSLVEKKDSKYGVIKIPTFYENFNDDKERSASKDVAREIEQLKKDGIQGIVIDLRGNGGGSLETALEISGMFIDKQPIVQLQSADKTKQTLYSIASNVFWNGPLVVLINFDSASASEVFAAAIQDYNRGIIIGSKNSYGKGTVQHNIDLNQYNSNNENEEDFGILSITKQKYYRVNGNSTQLEGVESQIILSNNFSYDIDLEKNENHVLPWDKINGVAFTKVNPDNCFETIIYNSKKRVSENSFFKLIDEQAKLRANRIKNKKLNLNFEKFKSDKINQELENKKFDILNDFNNNLIFKSTTSEQNLFKRNPSLKDDKEQLFKSFSSDIYIEKALNVLHEMKTK